MNEELLAQRIHYIFYRLSSEDPKFPKVNFFCRCMDFTRDQLTHRILPTSEEQLYQTMKEAAHQLILARAEDGWKELVNGWFPEDIFEALKPYIERR